MILKVSKNETRVRRRKRFITIVIADIVVVVVDVDDNVAAVDLLALSYGW